MPLAEDAAMPVAQLQPLHLRPFIRIKVPALPFRCLLLHQDGAPLSVGAFHAQFRLEYPEPVIPDMLARGRIDQKERDMPPALPAADAPRQPHLAFRDEQPAVVPLPQGQAHGFRRHRSTFPDLRFAALRLGIGVILPLPPLIAPPACPYEQRLFRAVHKERQAGA